MNWELFSPIGYASIAVWLCMPLLWFIHMFRRPRGRLCHVALVLGVAAYVLARINSETYINQIQVDRSQEIQEQLDRQEVARQAATQARENEVAQIRFAEDGTDDFLDQGGMDAADIEYLNSFNAEQTPEWKKAKKQRSEGAVDDSLEAQIGATEEQQGVESETLDEEDSVESILMSDKDKLVADRLDAANLAMIRVLLGLGLINLVFDYLKRANVYNEAYFPLPVPSSWVDSFTPREAVVFRPETPRRSLFDELQFSARRGEPFVYLTDDAEAASRAATTAYRFPFRCGPLEVLVVEDANELMDDEFVFETLWYGRNSFVVNSEERAEQMMEHFLERMQERCSTRARTRHTVNVVWDVAKPVSTDVLHQFASFGRAIGYTLLISKGGSPDVRPSVVNKTPTGPVPVAT